MAIDPDLVLRAYRVGVFPMADGRYGRVDWYACDPRAILPLEPGGMHVSRSLRKTLRKRPFTLRVDGAFDEVIRACAEPRPDGRGGVEATWISEEIIEVFGRLHRRGWAHCVEARCPHGGELVGGVYGLAIGRAFFAESMFSRRTDASKVALHTLWHLLGRWGYELFDTQYANDHTRSLGVVDIGAEEYLRRLTGAVARPPRRSPWRPGPVELDATGAPA